MTSSFSQFDLHPNVVQTVADLGYTDPTPIQSALIPVMLSGQDVIGQAQTGTGKTAAFALPTLSGIDVGTGRVQALVLVPTRELATQVASAVFTYGRTLGVQVLPIFGGQSYNRQINRLRKGVDVVVGTPGRLLDLIQQGALDLGGVAGRRARRGRRDALDGLQRRPRRHPRSHAFRAGRRSACRPRCRTASASSRSSTCATRRRARSARSRSTAAAIEERYYTMHGGDKTAGLARLLEAEPVESALVFARTRAGTVTLANQLAARGYAAEAINGEMTQPAREAVLDKFRQGRLSILVGTDVAARGLDIDHISHVFNYDLPRDPEVYVHRVGRTGRAGKSGVAISLVTPGQRRELQKIEAYTKQRMTASTLPTAEQIAEQREQQFVERVKTQLDGGATRPRAEARDGARRRRPRPDGRGRRRPRPRRAPTRKRPRPEAIAAADFQSHRNATPKGKRKEWKERPDRAPAPRRADLARGRDGAARDRRRAEPERAALAGRERARPHGERPRQGHRQDQRAAQADVRRRARAVRRSRCSRRPRATASASTSSPSNSPEKAVIARSEATRQPPDLAFSSGDWLRRALRGCFATLAMTTL